jgi:hypothetical protein
MDNCLTVSVAVKIEATLLLVRELTDCEVLWDTRNESFVIVLQHRHHGKLCCL